MSVAIRSENRRGVQTYKAMHVICFKSDVFDELHNVAVVEPERNHAESTRVEVPAYSTEFEYIWVLEKLPSHSLSAKRLYGRLR